MARILVLDDDTDILWILDATLASLGHSVEAASDAREGLALAMRRPPDLVVLDLMMPQLSGWEVLEALRSDPRTMTVPIILLSAHGDAQVRARGIRLGADDFLQKPFLPDELQARCERLLERRELGRKGLRGTLDSYPLSDLLQNLEQSSRSGVIDLNLTKASGMIVLSNGKLVAASYGELSGPAACVALLDATHGEFRFVEEIPDAAQAPGLSLRPLLLEAAWIRDELAARQALLPEPSIPMRRVRELASVPSDFACVPVAEVGSVLGSPRTLQDLDGLALGAPSYVKLAVAWLIEQGFVEALPADASIGSAAEVLAAETYEDDELAEEVAAVIRDLQQECVFRGVGGTPAVVAIVAASSTAWQEVAPLIASLPDHWFADESRTAKTRLWLDQKGELSCGRVDLHLRFLVAGDDGGTVDPVVRGAAAVVLWLGEPASNARARTLAGTIESLAGRALLLSVGGAANQPRPHLGGRWGRAEEVPRTLSRLLQQVCSDGA